MENDLVISSDGDYTIYKNLNTLMVDDIKNLEQPKINAIVDYIHYENSIVVNVLNDTQVLLIDDKNLYFVLNNEKYDFYLKQTKLNIIKKKFDLSNAINKTYPNGLFSSDGFIEFSFIEDPNRKMTSMKDYMRSTIYKKGFEVYSDYKKIGNINIKPIDGGTFCFAYLDTNGNINCRDYNFDIKLYVNNKGKNKHDLFKLIIDEIPDTKYENFGKYYYTDEYVLELSEFGVENFPIIKYNDNKKSIGTYTNGIIKQQNTTIVNRDHILSKLLPNINDLPIMEKVDLSEYINIEKSCIKNDNITFRIQKTLLNNKKYKIYDCINDETVLNNSILMNCLKQIETLNDIPNNVCIVVDFIEGILANYDLPEYIYYYGDDKVKHTNFNGLIKLPHGCNFTFNITKGNCYDHEYDSSTHYEKYYTDIINIKFID